MSNIYASSFIDGPELNPENLLESFENYAANLEEMATKYKKLVKFIRTKKIKILEAHGHSHGGFFQVDEIDTNRLKKAGFVIDFADELEDDDNMPTFYVDSELEEEMKDIAEELEAEFEFEADESDEEIHPHKAEIEETELFAGILEPDFEIPKIFEMEIKGKLEDKDTYFSLKDVIAAFKEDDDLKAGQIGVEIKNVDGVKFDFNLSIADLNRNPTHVQFDREECVFKYQCGSCDSWHFESLASVYKSLKTANALFSNLMVMTKSCKEVLVAFDFVDHDLRLLQSLLRFDYALDDDDDDDDED